MAIIPHATPQVKGLRQGGFNHLVATQSPVLPVARANDAERSIGAKTGLFNHAFVPLQHIQATMFRVFATKRLTLTNTVYQRIVTHNYLPFKLFSTLRKETVSFLPRLSSTTTPSRRILRTRPNLVLLPIPITGFIITPYRQMSSSNLNFFFSLG